MAEHITSASDARKSEKLIRVLRAHPGDSATRLVARYAEAYSGETISLSMANKVLKRFQAGEFAPEAGPDEAEAEGEDEEAGEDDLDAMVEGLRMVQGLATRMGGLDSLVDLITGVDNNGGWERFKAATMAYRAYKSR